jgi:hypothetical protein
LPDSPELIEKVFKVFLISLFRGADNQVVTTFDDRQFIARLKLEFFAKAGRDRYLPPGGYFNFHSSSLLYLTCKASLAYALLFGK